MIALIAALGKLFLNSYLDSIFIENLYSSQFNRLDLDRELSYSEADGYSAVAGAGQGQDGAVGGE